MGTRIILYFKWFRRSTAKLKISLEAFINWGGNY